jgi:HAD superfamily hydrolase (TIGR01450 family)
VTTPDPWVIDLDGVVWLGGEPIPGSVEALARLADAGHPLVYATNFSYAPVAETEAKLARMGVSAKGRVVTSAMAAAELVGPDETALLCAGPGVQEALLARGATVVRDGDADVVVVGYHPDFDYDRMAIASRALRNGARLVATNDDPTLPTAGGLLPGTGAVLASIVVASGVQPVVAGKPHEPMAAFIRRRLGPTGTMVGDRFDTDGGFATTLGYRFALVLTGVTTEADLASRPEPDVVAPDLAHLVELELASA